MADPHVVYLNPVGVVGGAERVLLAAVRQVRRLRPGWRVTAVLAGGGSLEAALAAAGARVHVLPLPTAFAGLGDTAFRGGGRLAKLAAASRTAVAASPEAFAYVRRMRSLLRELRPTILHSHGLKTNLVAAVARPPGVPVVWHVHDFYSERPVARKLLAAARRGVAAGVAISAAVARDAAAALPRLPVFTVRNAVDTTHFAPGESDAAGLDRLAGLPPSPEGTVRIGLVATYANWKGHAAFLESLAGIPGVRGYVVGGPIYATAGSQVSRADLAALAARYGIDVGFVPFQPDPVGIYRTLDVVVHASTRAEPFGLTVAEAMACGRAVVVSAGGGAAELFTDGVDAVGHRPGNVAELAAAVRRLAADPGLRSRLGIAARATAVANFGEDRFGEELVAVYDGL